MNTLHIYPQEPRREGESVVLSAAIEAPGGDRKTLWYSVPEDEKGNLVTNADPFVIGASRQMMEFGGDVRVHGSVSPSLIRNLGEFQAAWCSWIPSLRMPLVSADCEEEPKLPNREDAIMPFSGGVDSCFTAFRHAHAKGQWFQYRTTAAIMMHGFDIPLDQPEVFASALERSRTVLASLDIRPIPVATNFRSLIRDWDHSHGSALASCLMLFSKGYRAALIPQGITYKEINQYHGGSNAISDPLLSSDSFRIVPDGAAFTRAAKIFAMRDWKEFLQHLRVCWAGPEKDRNCCVCEKCIRNILTFRALGLGLPPCFPDDVEDERISTFGMGAGALPEIRYEKLANLAAAHGVQGKWLNIIEKRLAAMRLLKRSRILFRLSRLPHYPRRLWSLLRGRG